MCLSHMGAFAFTVSPYVPQPFPSLIKNRVLLHPQSIEYMHCLLPVEAVASFRL